MKKIVISLAGLLAAVTFAPEASAVPSFARQTGMACNACHWQSFPALNNFGRAFKAGGYTLMGAQAKVEGEHGLSIPNVLNASIYSQLRYVKTNGTTAATPTGKNNGRFDIPDEFALFFGGRVSENIGFVLEVPLTRLSGANGTSMIGNFKMPFLYDAGSVKLGAVPFTSAGIGAAYGFDLFATGSSGAGRITENGVGYSAAMYLGTTNTGINTVGGPADATGVALVAVNDSFHVNITPYHGESVNGGDATKFGATYVRAGWTPNFNGWDVGLGFQNWSGQPLKGSVAVAATLRDNDARATVIDGQAQGELSGMPLGIYASWGKAPKSSIAGATGAGTNIYNTSTTNDITAFGMMGDLWVIPGSMDVQLGFMRAKTGLINANTLSQETDNSYTLGARYKVRQNVKLGFAYTKFSGSAYDIGGSGGVNRTEAGAGGGAGGTGAGVPTAGVSGSAAGKGDSRTTFILSGGF